MQPSVDRTTRWLERCKKEMARLNSLDDTINKQQLLFGINQGAIYSDIRVEHAKRITDLDLDGYAVGGLAVGETHEEMYHILDIYIQTSARSICSTRSMSWICSPSSQGVNVLSADGIPEPISVTC